MFVYTCMAIAQLQNSTVFRRRKLTSLNMDMPGLCALIVKCLSRIASVKGFHVWSEVFPSRCLVLHGLSFLAFFSVTGSSGRKDCWVLGVQVFRAEIAMGEAPKTHQFRHVCIGGCTSHMSKFQQARYCFLSAQ